MSFFSNDVTDVKPDSQSMTDLHPIDAHGSVCNSVQPERVRGRLDLLIKASCSQATACQA